MTIIFIRIILALRYIGRPYIVGQIGYYFINFVIGVRLLWGMLIYCDLSSYALWSAEKTAGHTGKRSLHQSYPLMRKMKTNKLNDDDWVHLLNDEMTIPPSMLPRTLIIIKVHTRIPRIHVFPGTLITITESAGFPLNISNLSWQHQHTRI